jgi:uroporphyrinogen-III synthase
MQPKLYIEEVKTEYKPIEENKALTDEQLHEAGLAKVEAFIRTKSSAAAIRKARQRQKEKAEGLKQVNVTAPQDVKPILQLIAKECSEGKKLEDVLIKALSSVTSHGLDTLDDLTKRKIEIGEKVLSLKGWKKLIARIIGII